MAWNDFKRVGGWNVSGLGAGTTNPWKLSAPPDPSDNLTFEGDGLGDQDKDIIKKNGSRVASRCKYLSGDKVEAKLDETGVSYIITLLDDELTCNRKSSGGLSWTAVDG